MKRYYTVVFEITDEGAWKSMGPAFTRSLVEGVEQEIVVPGVQVVACGNGDTMTAYDALAELALETGYDVDQVVAEYVEAKGESPEEANLIIG